MDKPVHIGNVNGTNYFMNGRGYAYRGVGGIYLFVPDSELPVEITLMKIIREREQIGMAYHEGSCLPRLFPRPSEGF
ncbi:MAG: hypothetical protein HYT72_04100 [Candidatus Aenigmarchaeota archaeon]|nr:hypothetical protein [Candidatus Aenigmarchaeota archaeon]